MFRALLFFFFLVTSAQAFTANESSNYTIYPVEYDITIMPYIFGNLRYGGSYYYVCHLGIKVIANANINKIEMDAKNIKQFQNDSVQVLQGLHGTKDIVDKSNPYTFNEDQGKLIINLKESLIPFKGNEHEYYVIKVSFKKDIFFDKLGVLLVRYIEDREEKYIIQTRLSPNLAKYFIPCFENPRFESKFKFTVYIDPPGDENLPRNQRPQCSNTSIFISEHLEEETLPDKRRVIRYAPSPQLTLSQLSFHHSQFGQIKTTSKNTSDTIIVWAPGFKLDNCYYILNYGEEILRFFSDYSMLNRPITNGPINIIAIPTALNGYEVDSWNVLTNSEIRVINNPKYTSIQQIERMNFELAQQLSRVWLGNPGEPTRTRWREEWFREGIASYLAYYFMTQHNHGKGFKSSSNVKSRRQLDYYGFQMRHAAMIEDWHHSTDLRPLMDFSNELAANITKTLWKQLVTMKTASLLWMVENWIGSKRFHESLVKFINNKRGTYINLQEFMNSLDQDTVDCFGQYFNGYNTSKVLMSWLRHSGYPVVSVQVLRNKTPNTIELKQTRFSFTGEQSRESDYLIPISYLVQDKSNCNNCYQPRFTIDRQTYTFVENLNNGWIILNTNASGYYRVNYDKYTWNLIAKTLKDDVFKIGELNRAQIVNDVFALYVSGDMSQDLAMKILDYLDQESSLTVWESVSSGFEMLKIENAGCGMTRLVYSEWQRFLSTKLETIYKKIFNSIQDQRQQQQTLFGSKILELALAVGYQECFNKLYSICFADNKQGLSPNLRAACYYVAYGEYKGKLSPTEYNFNAYEDEDRTAAIKTFKRQDRFLDKIPKGKPRLENLVMPPPNPVNVHKGSAESLPVTSYLVLFCVLVSSVLYIVTDISL